MANPIYVNQSTVDEKVAFLSKNNTDPIQWAGCVAGVVTYAIAKQYGDLISYNAIVQQADPTVGAVTTLNWFLIQLVNGSGQTVTYAFANEWISAGSFQVIEEKIIVSIAVYDLPTNNHNLIIEQLAALGITAFITGVQS